MFSERVKQAAEKVSELDGWDAIDEQNPAVRELQQAISDQIVANAETIAAALSTPPGKKLYDMLFFIAMQPVAPPGAPPGYASFREGQNELFRKINQAINTINQRRPDDGR